MQRVILKAQTFHFSYFKTNIKHSLTPNSMVMLYFIAETSNGTTVESLSYAERVINVGKDGKDKEYFFTITCQIIPTKIPTRHKM